MLVPVISVIPSTRPANLVINIFIVVELTLFFPNQLSFVN